MPKEEHEKLVHLPSPEEELQAENVGEIVETDTAKPVNQWKLLKIIESAERKTMALGDLCKHFEFVDRNDERVWKPLQQLLRAGRITQQIGNDTAGKTGNVFTVASNEPNRRRSTRESEN